jgi:hypothetical protein
MIILQYYNRRVFLSQFESIKENVLIFGVLYYLVFKTMKYILESSHVKIINQRL